MGGVVEQNGHGATGEAGFCRVCPASENGGYAGAEYDASQQRAA